MSVTAAAGFRAAGAAAGIKTSGAPDVALVVNDGPADAAAAVFTTNRVQAAPVRWTRQVLRDGRVRAVVLNAGCANACTGPGGFADTHGAAEAVAVGLDLAAADVAVCSTGVIGTRLPMDRLRAGIAACLSALSPAGGAAAAEAIRTTDTVRKEAQAHEDGVTVGGMAKGAAMLAPGLATMLVILSTDAVAPPEVLDRVLRAAVRTTFERVDSDGCMSTNDTVLLMASGASGRALPEDRLGRLVSTVCADLARALLADAEGAGKEVEIGVQGAASEEQALEVARALARNTLLKCALAGSDPYWGRALAAAGTTGAAFDPDALDVAFNGVWVCRAGCASDLDGTADISGRQVRLTLDLHAGAAAATVWTTDLTTEYVHLNADYTT